MRRGRRITPRRRAAASQSSRRRTCDHHAQSRRCRRCRPTGRSCNARASCSGGASWWRWRCRTPTHCRPVGERYHLLGEAVEHIRAPTIAAAAASPAYSCPFVNVPPWSDCPAPGGEPSMGHDTGGHARSARRRSPPSRRSRVTRLLVRLDALRVRQPPPLRRSSMAAPTPRAQTVTHPTVPRELRSRLHLAAAPAPFPLGPGTSTTRSASTQRVAERFVDTRRDSAGSREKLSLAVSELGVLGVWGGLDSPLAWWRGGRRLCLSGYCIGRGMCRGCRGRRV